MSKAILIQAHMYNELKQQGLIKSKPDTLGLYYDSEVFVIASRYLSEDSLSVPLDDAKRIKQMIKELWKDGKPDPSTDKSIQEAIKEADNATKP